MYSFLPFSFNTFPSIHDFPVYFKIQCGPGGKELSYLQLNQGETSTGSRTTVVLDGRASDDGSQLVDGSGSDSGGLGQTSSSSSRLAAGLVEVDANSTLPVLVEVVVGQLLVVLDRHLVCLTIFSQPTEWSIKNGGFAGRLRWTEDGRSRLRLSLGPLCNSRLGTKFPPRFVP